MLTMPELMIFGTFTGMAYLELMALLYAIKLKKVTILLYVIFISIFVNIIILDIIVKHWSAIINS